MAEARVRWWVAGPVAVGLAVAGAVVDLRLDGGLGWVFAVAYAVGCLVAVLGVTGGGLVVAMVQPPVVAVLAVGVATAAGGPSGGSAAALAVGARLTAAFPLMAGMSGATVLIGLLRLGRRRRAGTTDR